MGSTLLIQWKRVMVMVLCVSMLAVRAHSDPPARTATAPRAAGGEAVPTCSERPAHTLLNTPPLGVPMPAPATTLTQHRSSYRGFGFFPLDSSVPAPSPRGQRGGLAITLSVPATVTARGPLSPVVTFRNDSNRTIRVLGALDGSFEHMPDFVPRHSARAVRRQNFRLRRFQMIVGNFFDGRCV